MDCLTPLRDPCAGGRILEHDSGGKTCVEIADAAGQVRAQLVIAGLVNVMPQVVGLMRFVSVCVLQSEVSAWLTKRVKDGCS